MNDKDLLVNLLGTLIITLMALQVIIMLLKPRDEIVDEDDEFGGE